MRSRRSGRSRRNQGSCSGPRPIAIQARVHPYYVLHVRSHTNLPAFVAEGVNPRGLKALELWQTDVTQVAEFGRLKHWTRWLPSKCVRPDLRPQGRIQLTGKVEAVINLKATKWMHPRVFHSDDSSTDSD
ncbi:hypothetical protein DUI87_35299 [Hirundo rustica rustica]|uniref:Uncharacterized protein n=1 Tax=Hirundo rustica rustica TaxID=333673 RepID=A0A3M0IIW6_HIRRU|nr:hypothetical protein DUI87_35299 [Hirundo rustica rustica]